MNSEMNITNAVNPYLSDVGVGLVFGLGYYFIKYLYGDKKDEDKKQSTTSKTALNFDSCKTIEDYNQLIKTNEDNEKLLPFDVITKMSQQSVIPDVNTYNNLLNSCFIQGNFEAAERLAEDLFDFASPINPDLSTFNILLKGISCRMEYYNYNQEQEKQKQVEQLDKVLEQMKKQKETNATIKPNDVTVNTCLDILIKAGETKRAWKMFDTMQEEYGVTPDKYTYSTIIKALKYDPDPVKLEKAFGIIEFLKSQKGSNTNDEIIFNCLIDVCVRLSLMDKAEKLFEEMKSLNVEPTKVTYAILIKGYGNQYNLEKAFKIFDEMRLSNLPPNEIVYGCLLNACVRCSDIKRVSEVYKEMKQNHLEMNIVLYTTLIKAYTKVKDLNSALDVYYAMIEDSTIQANIVSHNAILDCCVECHNTKKLNEIYQSIREKALTLPEAPQPDLITYSTVIKGYARAKDMDKVFDIYNFLKQNKDQFKLDEIIYNSVLDGCAKSGNHDMGMKVYQDMIDNNIKKSNVTYSILVKIYSNAKKEEKALAILDEMLSKGIKPGIIVYTCLIQTCLKAKKLPKAIELFDQVKQNNRPDHVLYNTIINGCLYHQNWEMACRYTIESLDNNIKIANDLYNLVLFKLSAYYCNIENEKKVEYASAIVKRLKDKGVDIPEETYTKVAKMIYHVGGNRVENQYSGNNNNKERNNFKRNNNNNQRSLYDDYQNQDNQSYGYQNKKRQYYKKY